MQKESKINNVSIQITLTLNIKVQNLQLMFLYKEKVDSMFQESKQLKLVENGESWTTSFKTAYDFTKTQVYRIDVLNGTQGSMGSVLFFLGNLIKTGTLVNVNKNFTLNLQISLLQQGKTLNWQWAGQKLLNTDGFFGKSDPYLQFSIWDEGQWNLVHQTEYIKDNLNPVWKPFSIDMGLLNHYDEEKNFKIECWDYSKKNNHKFIGRLEISWKEISNFPNKVFSLDNPNHVKCGELSLLACQIEEQTNLLKLLQKIQIQTIFIIQMSKGSFHLHSLSHEYQNIFQKLIVIFGTNLIQYNSENTIQLYGIGGLVKDHDHFLVSNGQIQQVCYDYARKVKEVMFGDKTSIGSSLFEFIKQVEIFKPNFSVGFILINEQFFDMTQFNQFLSHTIILPEILIVIALQNIISMQDTFNEPNNAKVHLFTLKDLTNESIQEITKSIMELILKSILIEYKITPN